MSRGVRRSPDVRRMAAAVSHPGIDPRTWLSWAIVKALGFDGDQGVFADVQLIPTGEVETVYVGTGYAGGGFGDWSNVEVDDQVLIGFPNGDPNNGGVLIARTWNGGDPPPAVLQNGDVPTKDRVLVVKPGQNWRVLVSGGGAATIENGSTSVKVTSSDVQIGDSSAVALAKAQAIADLQTAINNWAPVPNDGGAALKAALTTWLLQQYGTTKAKGT